MIDTVIVPYDMFVSITEVAPGRYVATVEHQGSFVTQVDASTEQQALDNAIRYARGLVRVFVGWESLPMRLLKRVPVGVRKTTMGSYHLQFQPDID
jgi:hypothetical protein